MHSHISLPGWSAEKVGGRLHYDIPPTASLADAGVALSADFAGVVIVGVAPLADAGVASLVDPAGYIAGGVIDLTVPAPVETVELLFAAGMCCSR